MLALLTVDIAVPLFRLMILYQAMVSGFMGKPKESSLIQTFIWPAVRFARAKNGTAFMVIGFATGTLPLMVV